MTAPDPFRYDGKHALVVGGATGMGAATADAVAALGADVTVLDYAPASGGHRHLQVDLREPADIDVVLKQIDGPVDALFSAAGVADGTPGLMKVNFIGHRHIIESLVDDGRLSRGAAICMVSSVAGLGWESNIPTLVEFLATPDYGAAAEWVDAHDSDNYIFSKQAMNCFVARQAFPLMSKGIRINAICPGPTDTPLARANADMWLGFGQDYRDAAGTSHLTPDQMAGPMTFLNSEAASGISGINLLVDHGYLLSSLSGSYEPGEPLAKLIFGRS
jgi:NAD(P)-dependent dehydrogenase (short-subunit alcohol dehydrogenase family)